MSKEIESRPVLGIMLVVVFYTLVTVVVTWPVTAQIGSHLVGYPDADQVQKVWAFWWTKEALLSGQNPASFPTLAYPEVYFSSIRWVSMTMHAMLLPFQLIFSPVTAYNIGFLMTYVFSGLAGFLLCRDITEDWRAGVFGGLIVMLMPQRAVQTIAGHVEVANLVFAVLYMLLLRRAVREGSFAAAVWGGVCFALAFMMHPTAPPYILFIWTALYVPFALQPFTEVRRWQVTGVLFGVGVLLMLPFLVPFMRFILNPPPYVMEGGAGIEALSSDILTFFTPSRDNPLIGGLLPYTDNIYGFFMPEVLGYMGFVTLFFALIALRNRRTDEERSIWLLITLLAALLSLGPVLKVGGLIVASPLNPEVGLPLPYALLQQIPPFGSGRTPGRFNLLAGICLAVLASWGMAEWLRETKGRIHPAVTMAAAGILLTLEYLVMWPVATAPIDIPTTVDYLAAQDEGVVLDIPPDRYVSHYAQFYQVEHELPLISGYSDRIIPHRPGVREILYAAVGPPQESPWPVTDPSAVAPVLNTFDVDYVLLHLRWTDDAPAYVSHLEEALGSPLIADDATILFEASAPIEPPQNITVYAAGGGWCTNPNMHTGIGIATLYIFTPVAQGGTISAKFAAPPTDYTVFVNDDAQALTTDEDEHSITVKAVSLQAGINIITVAAPDDAQAACVEPPEQIAFTEAP
ncbi:MAG: hypothetical protein GYB64_12590 [Chloroflexi bacterium]|nr:hypothetical protein [Chloroflexota bacterium]